MSVTRTCTAHSTMQLSMSKVQNGVTVNLETRQPEITLKGWRKMKLSSTPRVLQLEQNRSNSFQFIGVIKYLSVCGFETCIFNLTIKVSCKDYLSIILVESDCKLQRFYLCQVSLDVDDYRKILHNLHSVHKTVRVKALIFVY
jgi:predicted nucleic acid-binding Zn finger protein